VILFFNFFLILQQKAAVQDVVEQIVLFARSCLIFWSEALKLIDETILNRFAKGSSVNTIKTDEVLHD
jgi:hypothetical protein